MPSETYRAENGVERYNDAYQATDTSPSIRNVPTPCPDARSASPGSFVQSMPSETYRAENGVERYNDAYQATDTSPSIRNVPTPWPDARHVLADQQLQRNMGHFARQPRTIGDAYASGRDTGRICVVDPVYDGLSYVGNVLSGGVGRDRTERSLKPVSTLASTLVGGAAIAVTAVGAGISRAAAFTAGMGSGVVCYSECPIAEAGTNYAVRPSASIGRSIGAATPSPFVSGISGGAQNLATAGATIGSGFQSGVSHGYGAIARSVSWETPQNYQPLIVPTSTQRYVANQNPSDVGPIVYRRDLVASPSDEDYDLLDFATDYIATPLGFGPDNDYVGAPQVLRASPVQAIPVQAIPVQATSVQAIPVQSKYIAPTASYVDYSGSGTHNENGAAPTSPQVRA